MEKGGVDTNLFGDVDKDIKKAESLVTQMLAKVQSGFRNTKEISAFEKQFTQLNSLFGQIGVRLKGINLPENFTKANSEIQSLNQKLETSTQKLAEAKNAAKAFTEEQYKHRKYTKEQAQAIQDAVDNEQDLLEVIKRVNQEQSQKGQSGITKGLNKKDLSKQQINARDLAFQNVREGNLSIQKTSASAQFNTAQLKAYRQALKEMAVDGKSAQEALSVLGNNQNNIDKEFLESQEFVEAYTNDLKNLSLAATDAANANGTTKINKGYVSKNANQMLETGGQTVSGNFISFDTSIFSTVLEEASRASGITDEIKNKILLLKQQIENTGNSTDSNLNNAIQQAENFESANDDVIEKLKEESQTQEQLNQSFDNIKNIITQVLSLSTAWQGVKKVLNENYEDIKKLDASFTSIAMVTDYSVADLWESYPQYAEMANELGQETDSVIQSSALFYQQGLETNEALELTTSTMKLATLAGSDFETATQQMTAALRGFHMEMDEGETVTDVYSELAANAAASVDDIAYAMSKTASIANNAGMSFETTAALLTKTIETTQEAAENIGTAMKTVIARFTELKENVAGTDESEFDDLNYNDVDEALKSVGIQLKDTTGNFRDLDDVFLELSEKWDTLDRNSQRYIATTAAGSRQQSRFIAMMEDYDRTIELVETAQDSAGKSSEQFAKYQDSLEYKINQLKNSWEQLRVNFLDSDFFKKAVDLLGNFVDKINSFDAKDFVILGVTFITLGKTLIKNLIEGIQSSTTGLQTVINKKIETISKTIDTKWKNSRFLAKLTLEDDKVKNKTEIKELEEQVQQAEKEIEDNTITIDLDTQAALSNLDQLEKEYEEFLNEAKQAGWSDEESEEWAKIRMNENGEGNYDKMKDTQAKKEVIDTANTNKAAAEEAKKKAEDTLDKELGKVSDLKKKSDQRGQIIGQALTSAITTSITVATTEDNPMKAIRDVFISGMAMILPDLIAFATASGEATITAFITSTAGIGAIIVAAAALITGLVVALKGLYDDAQAQKFENRMKAAKEAAEEASEAADEAAQTAKESTNSYKDVRELKEEYEELNAKQVLTTEEQETYNDLVSQIQDEYPEIISYYNEATGELRVQNDLWDQIIDKAQSVAEADLQASLIAANASSIAQNQYDQYSFVDNAKDAGEQITEDVSGIKVELNADKYEKIVKDEDGALSGFVSDLNLATTQNYASAKETLGKYFNDIGQDEIDAILENKDAIIEAAKNQNEGLLTEQETLRSELASNFATTNTQLKELKGEDVSAAETKIDEIMAEKNLAGLEVDPDKLYDSLKWEGFASGSDTFFNVLGGANKGASGNNLTSWENLNEKDKISGLDDYNIEDVEDVKQALITALGDENAASDFWEENRKTKEGQMKIFREVITAQLQDVMGKETSVIQGLSDAQMNQLNEVYDAALSEGVTEEELSKLDTTLDILGFSKGEKEAFLQDLQETFDEAKELAENAGLVDSLMEGWSSDQMTAYANWVEELADTYGEANAKAYASSIISNLEKLGVTDATDIATIYQGFDFSTVTAQTESDFREATIEDLEEMGYEDAEAIYEAMRSAAAAYGVLDVTISTSNELDDFIENLKTINETAYGEEDTIISVLTNQAKDGVIALEDYYDLKESLENMGEDIGDYTTIDSSGKIKADSKAIVKLYESQITAQKEQLEEQKSKLKIENQELEVQLEQLKSVDKLTEAQAESTEANNKQLKTIYNNWVSIATVISKIPGYGASFSLEGIGEFEDFKKDSANDTAAAMDEILDEQIETLETKIQNNTDLIDEIEKQETDLTNLSAAQLKEFKEKMQDELDDLKETWDEALEDEADALEDVQKAQQDVIDKQKELNETLYGTDYREAKNGTLYNYETILEKIKDKADAAKSSLEDLEDWDNASDLMDEYLANVHKEAVYGEAEKQVYNQSIANTLNTLDNSYTKAIKELNEKYGTNMASDLSDIYDVIDGVYTVNYDKLNSLGLSDDLKDEIEEDIKNINDYQDKIEEIEEQAEKRQKEFQELQKKALQNVVSLQEEMMNTLKDKYQQEIDDLQDKYTAMEDADNDYLDALEDAIQKQRDLRDQQNDWEDLAQKEKKLSLMQRDTSGGNLVETKQLEEEVQDDRQQLLDDAVDNIIDNLKEMYELQKESRDAEIEYREALLDEGLLMQEVTAALANINTSDELVQWFYENTADLSSMSAEQLELEKLEWADLFDAKTLYMEASQADFESALEVSQDEIATTVSAVTETLTTESERALSEITTKLDDSIDSAKTSLEEALKTLTEKEEAYQDAVEAATDAQKEYTNAATEFTKLAEELKNLLEKETYGTKTINTNTTAGQEEQKALIKAAKSASSKEDFYSSHSSYSEDTLDKIWEQAQSNSSSSGTVDFKAQKNKTKVTKKAKENGVTDAFSSINGIEIEDIDPSQNFVYEYPIEGAKAPGGTSYSVDAVTTAIRNSLGEDIKARYVDSNGTRFFYIGESYNNVNEKTGKWVKFKTGGLVDYTGPAWVDGTKKKPEAFLNSEDTERIGKAAELLSNLELLDNNNNLSTQEISNTNVGDTTIEIHINIENVASDYDVDQAVERVKEDIVKAAQYTGSNVILKKS